MSKYDHVLPESKGSYALWFYLPRATAIEVGRLGLKSFKRGWYGYCGSASGPGGLRARLRHHLHHSTRRHWHIDYFKVHALIREIWLCQGGNYEHELSQSLCRHAAEVPVTGFGSSDCRCSSHFVRFPRHSQVREAFRHIAPPMGFRRLISVLPPPGGL